MKCALSPLPCPVAFGECDRDGECYVWRCENPHAPSPEPDAAQAPAVTGNAESPSSSGSPQQPASAAARKPCQYHKGLTCYCGGKALCLDAA